MKKTAILIVAALMIAAMMPAGQAQAAVAGTPHDVTTAAPTLTVFGVCSACHIPHKAFGDRLWPSDQSGLPAARGAVGALCSYCHAPGAGQILAAETGYPFKDIEIQTHGLDKLVAPDGTDALIASGLPYTPAATPGNLIECTSCHNVHDNVTNTVGATFHPFLQDDMDQLCSRCHPNRQFVGGAAAVTQGAWGAFYGDTNPGSHPVGTDVFADTSQHDWDGDTVAQPDSDIVYSAALNLVAYGAPAAYTIGAHVIDGEATIVPAAGNGVGCVTCHMVHGANDDAGTLNISPTGDLLVIGQSAMGASNNGNGDANNALCEGCHAGPAPGTYGGALLPNPGNSAGGTHPVDDYYPSGDMGVVSATLTALNWPQGDGGAPNPDADIICESCHMPHPLASQDADSLQPAAAIAGTATHILRNDEAAICDDCHLQTPAGHHPVGAGLMAGNFDDPDIGDQDADMECSDCHGGSGAHNWMTEGGVGLDPDWEPYDNGRPLEAACTPVPNTSKECVDCHTAGGNFSPTAPNVAGEFQNLGDASHWVGNYGDVTGWLWGGTALNPDGALPAVAAAGDGQWWCETWDDLGGDGEFGYSRNGGPDNTNIDFVCEGCHELEPNKNDGNNANLLANYIEGIAEGRNALCEGCHSANATDLGSPHPMTGSTISKAVAEGRGSIFLVTGAGSYADKGATGNTTYPAADQMNCDSCHQVHNAVNASGTYILEGGAAITGTPAGSVTLYGQTWANMEYNATEAGAARLDYQPFCNLCHSSGE